MSRQRAEERIQGRLSKLGKQIEKLEEEAQLATAALEVLKKLGDLVISGLDATEKKILYKALTGDPEDVEEYLCGVLSDDALVQKSRGKNK